MIELLRLWYRRYLLDTQIVVLFLLIITGLLLIIFLGELLAPVIAALVIAFVLETLVSVLMRFGIRRRWAVTIVFALALIAVGLFFGALVPLLITQIASFIHSFPKMIDRGKLFLLSLPSHEHFITNAQAHAFVEDIQKMVAHAGEHIISYSLSSVWGLLTLIVYVFLVPIMVLFFLLDKTQLLTWLLSFLPEKRELINMVWIDVDRQFIGYVRGKVYEIIIVWAMTFIAFAVIGLHFSLMLSVLTGLAIVIPYVGAIVAFFPILFVAYVQWGMDIHMIAVIAAYVSILFIDGNLLIPFLYAELISLHPVAIIISVLFFGGIWGIWGVFFAIPISAFFESVLRAVRQRVALQSEHEN